MMSFLEPTLAQTGQGTGVSLVQVLIYGVIGVIFVSTMIKNVINESKKKARRNQSPNAASNEGVSLDDIAARRRAQLQEMARQRNAGRGPAGQAPTGRPGAASGGASGAGGGGEANLSMAERIARARAAQQQQRGQARAGTPLPSERSATRQPPRSATPAPTGASARQQRAQALRQKMQQRQQQQRDALAARQRQIQQARAQRSAPTGQPQAAPTRRPLPPVQTPHPAKVEPHQEVHRMVEDVAVQEVGSSRRKKELAAKNAKPQLIDFARLSRKDLQRAFVLKEVLDRPVAERDPLVDSSL
ncbi:MAG: hypothetical protein AAF911_15235 [Planctomycetota bacterium]